MLKRRHETQSSNRIPVDLLMDILSLVPVKSIARFRCVSKNWALILRRQDFTELFLTNSCTHPLLLFTLEADGKLFFYSAPQPHNPDDNSSLVATNPYKSFPKHVPSCTPVCGLVLLHGHGYRKNVWVICNPATGEFITLPKVFPKKKLSLAKIYYGDKIANERIEGMFLGYDPEGKQFKVLCMTTSSCSFGENTHRVLTLAPGKPFWRPVEGGNFPFLKDSEIIGDICINGVLYFGARTFGHRSFIVCFDVVSEEFSFIDINEDMSRYHYDDNLTFSRFYNGGDLILFNYKGRLGLQQKSSLDKLKFWVLEDAENQKWSKHIYVLPPLEEEDMITYVAFVGMTGTGEFLWSSSSYNGPPHSLYLTFYNLETETFRKVNIQGFGEFNQHPSISISTYLDYVENVKLHM